MKIYRITLLNKETLELEVKKKLEISNREIGPCIVNKIDATTNKYVPIAAIAAMIVEDRDLKAKNEQNRQKVMKKAQGKK